MEGNNTVDYSKIYTEKANELAQKAYDAQQQAIQLGVDKVVSDINYQKEVAKQDELKEAKSAYTDYAKQINPYGVEREAQVGMGLNGSGFQESSKVNMHNTYQNRVSQAVDTTRKLFADFDNQINQAKMEGNIKQAEALYQQYQFQIENLWKGFDIQYKQNRDAINDSRYEREWQYQQSRDQVSDNRYNQEWEYKKKRDEIEDNRYMTEWERQVALDRLDQEWKQKQFDYQVNRDSIADSQWEQQFNLQKKNSSARSSGSSGSSKSNIMDLSETDGAVNNYSNTNANVNSNSPLVSAANSLINSINEVNTIRSIPKDTFVEYVSNAYESGKIDKNEVDRLLRVRGV